ncbi:acyltransferase [Bradyrhizobium sp. 76]|uniref:acyltransferase family protein n=1 Tax=Bradyrhizobium sp. 76 TaxID=2782680 RepID=UPI001FF7E736|nr:acyltransferase [Bradyrhizobium sp. 76]MCK1407663.1 acyltransferase [Bradyrhizobium sp. 76]
MDRFDRNYMPCLDGLRGLAALIVVLGHAPMLQYPAIIQPFARDYGVLIFFVLSGFLMGSLYLPRQPTNRAVIEYATSRVARILPLYFAVVLISYAIGKWDPDFVYQISAVQLARLLTFNGSVSVFWSIGPEVQFYGLFILLWWIAYRSRALFFAFTIALGAICVVTIRFWPGIFVLSKFHIFACGVLIAAIRPHITLNNFATFFVHAISAALLLAICFSSSFLKTFGDVGEDMTAFYDSVPRTAVAGIIVFGLSFDGWLGEALFATRPMRFLGTVSFSVYLLHEAVMYWAGRLMPQDMHSFLSLLLSVAAALAASYATNVLIENPARRRIKSIRVPDIKPLGASPIPAFTDVTDPAP